MLKLEIQISGTQEFEMITRLEDSFIDSVVEKYGRDVKKINLANNGEYSIQEQSPTALTRHHRFEMHQEDREVRYEPGKIESCWK